LRASASSASPPGQRNAENERRDVDQPRQPHRPVNVEHGRRRTLAERCTKLGTVAVAIQTAQSDAERAREGALNAAGVGARMRASVMKRGMPGSAWIAADERRGEHSQQRSESGCRPVCEVVEACCCPAEA